MAADEDNFIQVILPGQPILKPIELKNIGFLQKFSTQLKCPACKAECTSVVHLEVVTCWQKFLRCTNLCKTLESRYDINHYCSNCGCYIGRYVPIGCFEKCLSKQARKKAAADAMVLRKEPKNCANTIQKSRERVLEAIANDRAAREQQPKAIENK